MTIIIIGASRGIGKFLFEYFQLQDVEVYGTYNLTKLKGNKSSLYQVDVTDVNQINSFVSSLPLANKKIVLINCAGITYNVFAHKAEPAKWARVIDVNLTGSFIIASLLLPIMRNNGFGRIIFFSSVVAQTGIPGTSAYSASKAGLWGMTRTIAVENATKGITSNCINLGYFDIGMIDDIPQEMQHVIVNKIPANKFGNPKEIQNLVNYLINSEYTTGSMIDLNGGLV